MLLDERGGGMITPIMTIVLFMTILTLFMTSFSGSLMVAEYERNGTNARDIGFGGVDVTAENVSTWEALGTIRSILSFDAPSVGMPAWLSQIYWFFGIMGVIIIVLLIRGIGG